MPPVEDIDVHDKVKIGSDFRYGCNSVRNPKKSDGYYALDRIYRENGTFYIENVFIPHTNTTRCRSFALWDTDSACRDCPREKDYQYEKKCLSLR